MLPQGFYNDRALGQFACNARAREQGDLGPLPALSLSAAQYARAREQGEANCDQAHFVLRWHHHPRAGRGIRQFMYTLKAGHRRASGGYLGGYSFQHPANIPYF